MIAKVIGGWFIAFNIFLISLGLISHRPPGLLVESIGLAFCLNFLVSRYVLQVTVDTHEKRSD